MSRILAGLTGCVLVGACAVNAPTVDLETLSSVASPQTAIEWNTEARLTIVTVGGKFPCRAAVYMGIVHSAMYDAVVGIEGGYESYSEHAAHAAGASADAAAAQAAHDVLVAYFPTQYEHLDATLATTLSRLPDDQARADGIAYGQAVAGDILALRVGDNLEYNPPYTPIPGPGYWVPAPNPLGTGFGSVRPFFMSRGDEFRPGPPPALDSDQYARDLAEIREIGSANSTTRTAYQTESARMYTEHGIAQNVRLQNQLATSQGLTLLGATRMMAMSHMAVGDACIGCFDAKYVYNFWRPITGIRNDATNPDPTWTPLVGTPNHPSYTAAHACGSTSFADSLAAFFGTDHVSFTVDSTVTGTTHSFAKFGDLSKEIGNARVWGGIHWRSDVDSGAKIGRKVADLIKKHFLRPL